MFRKPSSVEWVAPLCRRDAAFLLAGAALLPSPTPAATAAPHRSDEAEQRWLTIVAQAEAGRLVAALAGTQALLHDFPHFMLAHHTLQTLQHAGRLPWLESAQVLGAANRFAPDTLEHEAHQRLRAHQQPPPTGHIPAAFLALPDGLHHALAIDTSRSRLYLLECSTPGWHVAADYYISLGKQGVDKRTEGDQRTPLGIYFTTGTRSATTLPAFYGAGALELNYPSALDRRRGRTGSGIWVHGSHPQEYARLPQATDGCVVLANPGMTQLLRQVRAEGAPVVLAEQLLWITPDEATRRRQQFEPTFAAWQQAYVQGDMDTLLTLHAPDFRPSDAPQPLSQRQLRTRVQAQLHARRQSAPGPLTQLCLLHDQREDETMVVTFRQAAHRHSAPATHRQYWARHGARWQLLFEGVIA